MKLKRLTALLLACVLVAGLLPVSAAAAEPVAYSVEGGCIYFDTETGSVTDADAEIKSAVIPETISGVKVTAIGVSAFEYCSSLVSITIPETVTSIGNNAFNYCKRLKSVTIPASVKTIGDWVFARCTALESVTFWEGVTSIGKRAFAESGLLEVVLPSSLTSLGDEAFLYCGNLLKASIPGTLKIIPTNAFCNCYKLSSITLGEGIESISASAFKKAALTSVTLPKSVTRVEKEAFQQCPLESLTLNEGLESVSEQAFSYTNISELVLPSTLQSVGNYAFGYNNKLQWLYIPVGLTRATTALYPLQNLTDIYYAGNETQWKDVGVNLPGVTVHYNSAMKSPSSGFSDVPESAWFHDTVNAVAKAGLVAGYADGTFSPASTLSWVQAVVFAVRLHQYNSGKTVFSAADQTDVWYQIYVDYAREDGIIDSVPANPNAAILRSAAAVIFAEVLKEGEVVNNIPNDYFSDVPAESFMYEAVYKLARAGICNGKGGGVFGVSDLFTRSEVAAIVARMAGLAAPARIV